MAKPISKNALTAYAVAAVVLVLDQLSKWWILDGLMLPQRGQIAGFGPIQLTMVWNEGVSFGLFQADQDITRWVLAGFSAIVAVVLARWALKIGRPLLAVAVGMVMGGAVGNLIDRVRLGAVVDFIDASALWFPWVFNVADSGITIGVMLLLLDTFLSERRAKR